MKPGDILKDLDLDKMAEQGRKNIEAIRTKGPSDNSALTWFPPIRALCLRVPRTVFVLFEPEQLWPMLDGKEPNGFPMSELEKACEAIGYPVFIRTDLSSAKHDGPEAYRADSKADLWRCVYRTFEDNALKDLASFCRAFMVREWLDLDGRFTAFRGHLISREWRVFVTQEEIKCWHFYWPPEAIEYGTSDPQWREKLARLSGEPMPTEIRTLSLLVAQSIGHGEWSVDWARDKHGDWWLTDMARAQDSWHAEHEEG